MVKVIIKEPYKQARVEEIEYTPTALQGIVKGIYNILPFPSNEEDVDLITNDDAQLIDGFGKNIKIKDSFIAGVIVACGFGKDGMPKSLNDEQISRIMDYMNENSIEKKPEREM